MCETADVLIVGGGPVGATLALALRDSGLAVTVLEARPAGEPSDDARTLALSEGSRRILENLALWPGIAPHATPIATIHVSQRGHLGRTVFHAGEFQRPALGYVLPYAVLADAMGRGLSGMGANVRYGAKVVAVRAGQDQAEVILEGEALPMRARLVVVADGGRALTDIAGMRKTTRDYGQSALVAHVRCSLPHGNVAYERFTSQGPVALLPEGDQEYALVWTADPQAAHALCAEDASRFLSQLYAHFGDRVGAFSAVRDRAVFPLRLSTVRPVSAPHLVVIGNAAQTLHPVAGQGFNLGLRDAWELAIILRGQAKEAIGAATMLEIYRKRRAADTEGGIFFTDFLARSFTLPWLGHLRGAGLMALELLPPLKQFVVRKMSFGARG